MSEPIDVRVNPARTLAIVEIPLHGTGETDEALASLAALRDDVVPATIGKVPGTTVNISGDTAGSKDFNDTMKAHLPIVFGFVLGAAFLLLLFTSARSSSRSRRSCSTCCRSARATAC